jgi:TRAP-type C4-dicarboxylate transport system permease small subunit
MASFLRARDRIETLERWAALASGITVAIIMLILVYSVIMRYLFRSPALWTLEIAEYLLVAAIFLAIGFVLQVEGHVNVDILLFLLPRRAQLVLDGIVVSVVIIAFSASFCYASFQLAASYKGVLSDSIYKLPLFPSFIMVPIGSFLLLLQAIIRLIKNIHRLRKETGGGA